MIFADLLNLAIMTPPSFQNFCPQSQEGLNTKVNTKLKSIPAKNEIKTTTTSKSFSVFTLQTIFSLDLQPFLCVNEKNPANYNFIVLLMMRIFTNQPKRGMKERRK